MNRFGISMGISPREPLVKVGEVAKAIEERGFEALWFIDFHPVVCQVPARRCWPKPWPGKQGCLSSAFPPQSSWKSSQGSVLPGSGTCSNRPRSQRPASFSSTRCLVGAREGIVSPGFSYRIFFFFSRASIASIGLLVKSHLKSWSGDSVDVC